MRQRPCFDGRSRRGGLATGVYSHRLEPLGSTTGSDRQASQAGHRRHDPADLGEAAQPTNRRVAREGRLADVVEQLMAVVRSEWDTPTRITSVTALLLLLEQSSNNRHHVDVAGEMVGLHERAV